MMPRSAIASDSEGSGSPDHRTVKLERAGRYIQGTRHKPHWRAGPRFCARSEPQGDWYGEAAFSRGLVRAHVEVPSRRTGTGSVQGVLSLQIEEVRALEIDEESDSLTRMKDRVRWKPGDERRGKPHEYGSGVGGSV